MNLIDLDYSDEDANWIRTVRDSKKEKPLKKGIVHSHSRMGKHGYEWVKEYRRVDPDSPVSLVNLHTVVSTRDFEEGTTAAYNAVVEASENLLKEHLNKNKKLALVKNDKTKVAKALKYVGKVIKDKVDVRKQYKEIKELGKKHGKVFLAYAIAIEVFEDIILPAFLSKLGYPEATPILLAWHSEWFMYPLYFAVSKRLKKNIKKSYRYIVKEVT